MRAGLTFFDTALVYHYLISHIEVDSFISEAYGNGESERIIGRLIKEETSEENKARLYITTKCTSIAIINAPEPFKSLYSQSSLSRPGMAFFSSTRQSWSI